MEPTPPVNVSMIYKHFGTVPVDCTFDGYEEGMAIWRVHAPHPLGAGDTLSCDELPPRTSLVIEFDPPR